MAKNDRDLNIRLNADPTGFERGMKNAEVSARAFERALEKMQAEQRQMASYEAQAYREQDQRDTRRRAALTDIGNAAGLTSLALTAGLGAAVKVWADFDQGMSNVAAATHESTANMELLRQAAIDAGSDTSFSATEAAGAIEELAKAGVATTDILNGGLKGALDLAAAGGIDVASAAEAAASAMTQFGLSGEAVPHIADLLAAAAGKAQGGVSDMNYALSQAGLVAAQMGIDIDSTVGTLGAFASAGLLGSDAGTSFRTMLLALANPSEAAANTMLELGINAYDAQGNFVGMAALSENLKTSLSGLTQEQRNAALATIFGSDAIRAASILYTEGGAGIDEWTSKVNDTGYAAETAEKRLDNFNGSIERLKGSVETLLIALGGSMIGDWAKSTADSTDRLVDNLGKLPKPLYDIISVAGATVAAITGIGFAASLIGGRVVVLRETMEALGITMASLRATALVAAPWAALAGGILVASAALNYADRQLSYTSVSAKEAGQAILGMTSNAKGIDKSAFNFLDVKTFGIQIQDVKDGATALDVFRIAANKGMGGGWADFQADITSFGQNGKAFNEQLEQMDAGLASLIENGHVEEAQKAFKQFREIAIEEGASGKEFDEKFALYAAALQGYTANQESANAAVSRWSVGASEASGQTQALSDDMVELRDNISKSSAEFIDIQGAYDDGLKRKQEAEKESAQATAEATESSKDSWKDFYDEVSFSLDEYLADLQKQADAQAAWQTNLLLLTSRLSPAIVEELAQLGPSAAPYIQALVDGTDEQLAQLTTIMAQRTSNGVAAFGDVLAGSDEMLHRAGEVMGQAWMDPYLRRLQSGQATSAQIAEEIGTAIQNLIPKDATTTVKINGKDVAVGDLRTVKSYIDGLQGKTITVRAILGASGTVAMGAGGTGGITKADGGYISGPGGPTDDAIPAWLSNGEYVVRASQTKRYRQQLEAMNAGHFATGGYVGRDDLNINLPAPRAMESTLSDALEPIVRAAEAAADAADSASASVVGANQGNAMAGGQGSGWQWQIATLRKAFPGLALNSAFRAGSKTVSGNTSYHARGRAVDVPPRMDVFRWLLANYGNSPEIIYSPANGAQIKNGRPHMYSGAVRAMHFNHVHWAYDQGGVANGKGFMPKLTDRPERVLGPKMTQDFERLVDLLGAQHYADGGLVSRATRGGGSLAGSTTGAATGATFANGFDVSGYLGQQLAPKAATIIDDSALRAANFELLHWNSMLSIATTRLDEAKTAADHWAEELRDSTSDYESAQRDVASGNDDVVRATKSLADAQKSLDRLRKTSKPSADALADAEERVKEERADLTKATAAVKTAETAVTTQRDRMQKATQENTKATTELADATNYEASMSRSAALAAESQAEAQNALTAAKAEALAYAQKIAAAALAGSELTGLFTADDAARALEYAQNAYAASQAEAQAATDATTYQAKIDQLAAAGQRLAQAQAAMGASYATQKATIAGTRAEVERLAISYGFTAEQARALAESSVPLANTGETLIASLERQLNAVVNFSKSVETLRALGLSQGLIDQIMEAGPEKGLAVAEEIISGGIGMVKRLNDTQAALIAASNALGQSAATAAATKPTASWGSTGTLVDLPRLTVTPTVERGNRVVRAEGGLVRGPGGPTGDEIPAWLSDREYVVKASAVARYGVAMLDAVNAERFAGGGLVGGTAGRPQRAAQATQVIVTAPASGPTITGPLLAIDTIREAVDMDAFWQRAPSVFGPLGLGGGRG